MESSAARLRRSLACLLGAAVAGLLGWLIAIPTGMADPRYTFIPIIIGVAACAALGTWLGLEVAWNRADAGRSSVSGHRSRFVVPVLLLLATAIAGGLLLSLFAVVIAPQLLSWVGIAVAAVALGAAVANLVASTRRAGVISRVCMTAFFSVVYGASLAAVVGLVAAVTYKGCPPHAFCIDLGRWYTLRTLPIAGAAAGLWLAVAVSLGIILGRPRRAL